MLKDEKPAVSARKKLKVAQGLRLTRARELAGYRTAKEFSDKHGIPQPTYSSHEAGTRGYSDVAKRYAALLGNCDAGWLLTGSGREPVDGRAPASAEDAQGWFWDDDVEVVKIEASGATPLPGGATGLGFQGSGGRKIVFPMTRQLIDRLRKNLALIEKKLTSESS